MKLKMKRIFLEKENRIAGIVLLAGLLTGIIVSTIEMIGGTPDGAITLQRNDYLQGSYEENLKVKKNDENKSHDITIEVIPRQYEKSEKLQMIQTVKDNLPERILGENKTLSRIEHKLVLVTDYENLPVKIEWYSSDNDIVDWEGTLGDSISEEGCTITLEARITCDEENDTLLLELQVFPEKLSEEETFQRQIQEAVVQENENQPDSELYYLPDVVNGAKISWSKTASHNGITIILLSVFGAILIYFGKKQEEKKNEKLQEKQMELDYPELVSKMCLLLQAGLSSRRMIGKIALDYQKTIGRKKRPAYEELTIVYQEMEGGISEWEAYEHLGKRCTSMRYKTLSALLMQNLKKGGREMIAILEKESVEAFEERKRNAKILGEEAGTKLLLPMMLMLVVVLVILMVPAYLSF